MRRASIPVAAAAAQLDQITTLAASDIEPTTLARVRELIDVTSERAEMDPTWCVIGMLGGTGAGKSSLVNALCGAQVVRAGILRPTTKEACAVLPAGREPAQLLGWLGVTARVDAPAGPEGDTVIVDLPDIDSVEAAHAEVAQRLASRVDALVVVVNPQKYADARLHDEWLSRLRSSHASVTVALTHIDTLDAASRASVESDLRRILDARGLAGARIFPASATTGEGVSALAAHLGGEAARVSRQAARARAALAEAAVLLRDALGLEGTIRGVETEGLAGELAQAAADLAGAPIIEEAVAGSTRRAGARLGGWLPCAGSRVWGPILCDAFTWATSPARRAPRRPRCRRAPPPTKRPLLMRCAARWPRAPRGAQSAGGAYSSIGRCRALGRCRRARIARWLRICA